MFYDPDRYADWPLGKKSGEIRKPSRFPRICATCLHLTAEETGREFPGIIDTEYTIFSCNKLGWKTKEFYLMKPPEDILEDTSNYHECPFWEPWSDIADFNYGEESAE